MSVSPSVRPSVLAGSAPRTDNPIVRWLADDARFWIGLTLLLGLFAILKGVRSPGDWALTQAQFDYSHGFIKRGLLGALYSALHLHHRRPLTAVFFAELALFFLLLVLFTRRSGFAQRFGTPAVLAAFAGSYAVTYLTHLVGYTDILLAAITILLLSVRQARPRFLLALVLVPVAMLIHESFLFLFLPILLFSFILDSLSTARIPARSSSPARHATLYALILAAVALVLVFLLALRPNLSVSTLQQFHSEMDTRVDFPMRNDVFPIFSRSLRDNVLEALSGMKHIEWLRDFSASTLALLPVLALALVWMRRLTRAFAQTYGAQTRRAASLAALAASLSPLLMHVLGWDCARWNVNTLLVTFLALLVLSQHLPGIAISFSTADRNAVILLIAISMASGSGFFDRFETRPFPFFPSLMYTRHSARPIPRS